MSIIINNVNGVIQISSEDRPNPRCYYGGSVSGSFCPSKNQRYLISIGGDFYDVYWEDLNIGGISPITYKDAARLLSQIFAIGATTSPLPPQETTLKVYQSSNFDIGASVDFTIEWFMYLTGDAYFPRIFSVGQYPTANHAVSIEGGSLLWWANSNLELQSELSDLLFK